MCQFQWSSVPCKLCSLWCQFILCHYQFMTREAISGNRFSRQISGMCVKVRPTSRNVQDQQRPELKQDQYMATLWAIGPVIESSRGSTQKTKSGFTSITDEMHINRVISESLSLLAYVTKDRTKCPRNQFVRVGPLITFTRRQCRQILSIDFPIRNIEVQVQ